MIRILAYFLALLALAVGAAWLADHPGFVIIEWRGYRIETSAAVAGLAVGALMAAAAGFYRLWRWLRWGAGSESRRRRGSAAISQGLVAVAGGELARARKLARRAEGQLGGEALTLLLSAQVAQLAGEDGEARRHYTAMLEHPETEFLGLRGLLAPARRAADKEGALTLARRARELRPDMPWVLAALFDLEAAAGHWAEAQTVLARAVKAKFLDPEEARRRKALVLLGRALEAERQGDARALDHALEAHEAAPGVAPAAALAARLLAARGKGRRAAKVIEQSWARAPHPDLVLAFAALAPEESAEARLRRFSKLAAANPEHPETRVALGRLALAAGEWEEARAQLRPLAEGADARVMSMLAALEDATGGDAAAVRAWRLRASALAPEPAWSCEACGRAAPAWEALCAGCGAFDSLRWAPPERAKATALAAPERTPARSEAAALPRPGPALEAEPTAVPAAAPPRSETSGRVAQDKGEAEVVRLEAPQPEMPLPPDVPAPSRVR